MFLEDKLSQTLVSEKHQKSTPSFAFVKVCITATLTYTYFILPDSYKIVVQGMMQILCSIALSD
jgi:membrane-bound metal-dependent hydrolase YbcI (DUF457 family)